MELVKTNGNIARFHSSYVMLRVPSASKNMCPSIRKEFRTSLAFLGVNVTRFTNAVDSLFAELRSILKRGEWHIEFHLGCWGLYPGIFHPAWWYTYPSEKYYIVSWDDYSQYMEKSKPCSKPPTRLNPIPWPGIQLSYTPTRVSSFRTPLPPPEFRGGAACSAVDCDRLGARQLWPARVVISPSVLWR